MISLLKALMWMAIVIFVVSFWSLLFFQTWFFWYTAAAAVGLMCLGAWLANLEQN
ncbi:MAG TPA: hypothetical protein VFE32_17180 [Puia sp.]|jgi:hypothetical protein|nr:hypothetical protein [Puia sp.]